MSSESAFILNTDEIPPPKARIQRGGGQADQRIFSFQIPYWVISILTLWQEDIGYEWHDWVGQQLRISQAVTRSWDPTLPKNETAPPWPKPVQ